MEGQYTIKKSVDRNYFFVSLQVVAEISTPDMGGSEIDLGLSPGGKIKVVISSSIKLDSLVR